MGRGIEFCCCGDDGCDGGEEDFGEFIAFYMGEIG
jgi:hypothetical protein